MEDSRQDLRTECRGGVGVVGFGRIWPCISRDVIRAPCIVKPARGCGRTEKAGQVQN
jgi:hypothetical protein